ncbi:hypothetical protein ACTFIR_011858 [Dictyostelium discoideum]
MTKFYDEKGDIRHKNFIYRKGDLIQCYCGIEDKYGVVSQNNEKGNSGKPYYCCPEFSQEKKCSYFQFSDEVLEDYGTRRSQHNKRLFEYALELAIDKLSEDRPRKQQKNN